MPSAGRSPGRAPRRCGCTARARVAASREDRGWRCSPSQDRPRLDLPRPRLRRPGLPPSPRRRPEPLLPGAHAPSPASCGCTSSAVGRGPELRGGARGGRTLEAEGRARGAGNGRQRQAGRPGARTQPADPHSPARSPAAARSRAQGGDRCRAQAPRCGPLGRAARTRYVSPNPRPRLVALREGRAEDLDQPPPGRRARGRGKGRGGSPGPAVVIFGLCARWPACSSCPGGWALGPAPPCLGTRRVSPGTSDSRLSLSAK